MTWDTIDCIERNGIITDYTVVFQEQGGASVPGNTVNMIFSAEELTPGTSYTFQVAGVNDAGTGSFTDLLTIFTTEDGLLTFIAMIMIICPFFLTVPGTVSNFTVHPALTSVNLMWSAPLEPNGVIISYEITYSVTGNLVTIRTSNLIMTFSISSLTPQTTVSNISVSAYTSIGRGEAATLADQTTLDKPRENINIQYCLLLFNVNVVFVVDDDCLALVMNVVVEVVSDTSVKVSWDSVDIPEITGFTVYYSQTGNRKRQGEGSITVPSSDNSVVIEGLLNNVEYQFQVVAIAELDGDVIMGQRSVLILSRVVVALPTTGTCLPATTAPALS